MFFVTNDGGRYNQRVECKIDASFSPGEEVHLLTQDAGDERILNVRVFRVAPSRGGHVGYTRKGFYLTEAEALILRDSITDLLETGAFERKPSMQEFGEALVRDVERFNQQKELGDST